MIFFGERMSFVEHDAYGSYSAEGEPQGQLMVTLEVITERDGRRLVELTSESSVLGRYEFCDVVLKSHTVSREHARIVRDGAAYFIEDLHSLNGTFVNGVRIEERVRLRDLDRIHIYQIPVVFHERAPGEVAALSVTDTAQGAPLSSLIDSGADTLRASGGRPLVERMESLQAAVDGKASLQRRQATERLVQRIGGSADLDDILPAVLDELFVVYPKADRAYILLAEKPDGHLVPRAIKHRRDAAGHSMTFGLISRRTAAKVMSEREPLLMNQGRTSARSLTTTFCR